MPCEHLNFDSYANVGRHTAGEGGPVFAYTIDFALKCADCDLSFHFGSQHRRSDDGLELKVRVAPGPIPDDDTFCPGQWRCPVCLFRLSSNNLDAKSGAVSADRDLNLQRCPNDCGLLERLTWQESANEAHESARQIMVRALAAEARVKALEDSWPDNAAMPAELLAKYDPFAADL